MEIRHQKDSFSPIMEKGEIDTIPVNFVPIDKDQIENLFYSAVNKILRHKDTLQTSDLLQSFGKFSSMYFSKRRFSFKRFDKLKRVYENALPYFNTNFGVVNSYTFQVSVSEFKGTPYYDKNDSRSDLHLFIGSKKDKDRSKPIPLYNEKQFSNIIQKELLKIDFIRDNKMSTYSFIAFDYKVEHKNKSDIPKIRFFVYFGGKRLKMIKDKMGNILEETDDNEK